ncbi:phenylalanine--tRNA ligase subunit beta [Prosthecochloris sp. N3]|uniref:Phenylalanine--tRNA ligase beta subunit n=1 Tax=Prosthecochloris ethylica TaxID=2743976 RepID=A0ABR9XTP7_9CHLB|nr:phenylalanine--tRNA ligase subunit beta [Prosthecochloris ethylica]MBF0586623.1 phenylalanine--tRNA ligase subunit beta [Prosthecochloris ethylica]MBF0637344.1 phenylalanine--tRNA ligase subunit beta [Prosthecochloris ethylica]NUK48298.1 phenylalanine--tRNA ligase subunit beta [Prosthecochloris ethylica]
MKISINWLQDFIPSFSPDISSFVDQLTFSGLEVEDIIVPDLPDDKVVVGAVEEVTQHPDADRLSVCHVDVGADEPLQIVCGAPNVAEGQKVPVATIGARLSTPDGGSFAIKKSKIRGQRSFGMICAADELGLSGDHSGIMVLDDSCTVGTPLRQYLETDTVLDISVTPNRPDVLSHLGVAREVAGVAQVRLPESEALSFTPAEHLVSVEDHESCPYYTAVLIRDVTVAPSPDWLKKRLERVGLRPKNNIVDITNYILHGLGQPLHAFDADMLDGGRVVVRSDQKVEMTALDQETYTIEPGMAAICDRRGPVAIAGVMGGEASSVTDVTTSVLLESAYFDPASVRRTSKQLGLSSDSSYRFERGVDPHNVRFAARCAVNMILELAGGRVVAAEEAGGVPAGPSSVAFRPRRANALLGCSIDTDKMVSMLEHIGFGLEKRSESELLLSVPSFRVDVEQEIDLVEEVARLEGYNNIAPSENMVASYPSSRSFPEYFPDYLRSRMISLGFREVLTNPLMTRREAELFSSESVAALNPISEGLEVLRPSLTPALLKVISYNIKHGNRDLQCFEVGRVFRSRADEAGDEGPLGAYHEDEHLCVVMTGNRSPLHWSATSTPVDIFDMKGAVEMLLRELNLLEKSSLNIYNDATLSIDLHVTEDGRARTCRIGTVGSVEQSVLETCDIDQPVFAAELDAGLLKKYFSRDVIYIPPSRYPVVQRDLSFVLPDGVAVKRLIDCVKTSDSMICNVVVFDVFERETDSGAMEKSIALSLHLADSRGTLRDKTISRIVRHVTERVESEIGAVIRQV